LKPITVGGGVVLSIATSLLKENMQHFHKYFIHRKHQ